MKKKGGGGKGHTSKHAGSRKHAATGAKHHPRHEHLTAEGRQDLRQAGAHTKGRHQHHARGLAVGDLLPVCSFEALAMSLRLLGQHVADDDVAGLWDLSGRPEEGVGIRKALRIAAREGVGGVRPGQLDYRPLRLVPGPHDGFFGGRLGDLPLEPREGSAEDVHALILGVDLPGPHAVLATPDGWWSWGELWTPWTTAVSEAWVISWQ